MEKSDLKYIEQLAAIHIEQKDEETVLNTINNVLDYVSILDTYTLDDTMQINEQMTEGENFLREDEAKPSISLEEALSNATRKNENFFKVPKVIE